MKLFLVRLFLLLHKKTSGVEIQQRNSALIIVLQRQTPGREVNTHIMMRCDDAILLSVCSHPHQYPTVHRLDMKEWINFKSSHLLI